jgi:transcriptional regulator with XRE-family HTH domain
MDLLTYIEANGLSPSKFAERVGVPPSTITRVLSGDREPGLGLLKKIHSATNGAVTPNDFLPSAAADRGAVACAAKEAAQ